MAAGKIPNEKCEFITVNGHRVLVYTLHLYDPADIVASVERMVALVQKEPDHSVRIVLDVTEGAVTDEGTAKWKAILPLMEPKVLKGAVVGTGLKRLVTNAVLMVARLGNMPIAERIHIFGTMEEATKHVAS
jgi:hypothetical protein